MLNYSIPKSEYVISSHNDTLQITQSGTTYTVDTIVHGIYNVDELATELGTRISAFISGTMTVTFVDLTETFTFTVSSGDFTLDFRNYPVLGTMLGFDPTATIDSASSVATAPNRADLTRGRYLEIVGAGFSKYYGNTDTVAYLDMTQDINTVRDASCVRTFTQPVKFGTIILDVKICLLYTSDAADE